MQRNFHRSVVTNFRCPLIQVEGQEDFLDKSLAPVRDLLMGVGYASCKND
jgi:hypothetical protein